jgi:small conductance mechanosensitive channel
LLEMEKIYDALIGFAKTIGTSILEAVAVLLVGIIIIKLSVLILKAIFSKSKVEGSIASFTISVARAVLTLFLFFFIMDIFNVDTTSVITIVAASGLAIGLALQDSISNLASGVIMMFTKPFKENDYVMIGGVEGTVKKIKITTTELSSADNIVIRVPNKNVVGSNISNFSERPTRRVDIAITVAPTSDIDKVFSILTETAKDSQYVLSIPESNAMISSLTEAGIEFKIRMWVQNSDYWTFRNIYFTEVLKKMQKEGIVLARRTLELSGNDEERRAK